MVSRANRQKYRDYGCGSFTVSALMKGETTVNIASRSGVVSSSHPTHDASHAVIGPGVIEKRRVALRFGAGVGDGGT